MRSHSPARRTKEEEQRKLQEFAAAIVTLIEDDSAVRKASNRDLAVLEGVLTVIVESVTAELDRRARSSERQAM